MLLPKVEHTSCRTLQEASSLLQKNDGALLYAGGTDLFPRLKYGLPLCRELISLKGLAPRPPEVNADRELVLDALTTLADLAASPAVKGHSPMAAEAAWAVASNQVRNSGTLGGNLCQESRCLYYNQSHAFQFVEPCFKRGGGLCYLAPKGKKCFAVFMSDLATALIALGARVEVVTDKASRTLPLAELYSGDSLRPLTLAPGEILARVTVPPLARGTGWGFAKFSLRGGLEYAAFNLAATLTVNRETRTCQQAGLACGAVTGGPIQVGGLGEMVAGKVLTQDLYRETALQAASLIRPHPHHGYSAAYLKEAIKQEIELVLALAAERAA